VTDQELLARVEQQAVEIAKLKEDLRQAIVAGIRLSEQLKECPNEVYRQMARAAVNCGSSYGCSLAKRYDQ